MMRRLAIGKRKLLKRFSRHTENLHTHGIHFEDSLVLPGEHIETLLTQVDSRELPAETGRPQARNSDVDAGVALFTHDHQRWMERTRKLYDSIYHLNIFRHRLAYFEDDLELLRG
jgi:hypothetical protein